MIARLFAAAFALLAALSAAHAQNVTCFTAPSGDDTTKCASTAFVQGAFSGGALPVSPNYFLAGPTSGSPAAPTFRPLSILDFNSGTNASASTFWRGDGTWAAANQRTTLTGPQTFYVNFSTGSANCNGQTCGGGSDSTGDGSLAKPWKTRNKAYSVLASQYDLAGNVVTIQLADGTITDSFQVYQSMLMNQSGPGGLVFQGNCTTPTNVLVQTAAGLGYTYGFFYGASATLKCQKLDQSAQVSISPSGADIVSAGQGSSIIIGSGMWFGCNFGGYNALTISFNGYVQFDDDFTNDVGSCQKTPTGTYSIGGNTITVSNATGLAYGMGIINATGFPPDVYVYRVSGTTVTVTCRYTSPCTSSANETNTPLIFTGGGQYFLNLGNNSTAYFNTNGQSDYSIIATLGNYPHYLDYFYFNDRSSANMQGITWVNAVQATGGCLTSTGLSVADTGLIGVPYSPCRSAQPPTVTATLTLGSNSFTVSSSDAAKLTIGQAINGYAAPNGTWNQGSSTIALSGATGSCIGAYLQAPGLLTGAGAYISNLVGTTVTLPPCGSGPKCVSGYATYIAETNVAMNVTGCGIANGSVVTGINGTTITVSKPATASGSQLLAVSDDIQDYSVTK